jgi:hypothetical protein
MLCEGRLHHVVMVHHNGRPWPHIRRGWFGNDYPKRWNQAASSYLDIRGDKATNGFDISYGQTARRIADEASDNLSTRAAPPRWVLVSALETCWVHPIFYAKPFLGFVVLWLSWFLVATGEKPPRRYIPSHIYWHRTPEGHKVARLVSVDNDLRVRLPRVSRYLRECCDKAGIANRDKRPAPPTECHKVILKHWPLIVSMVNKSAVPLSERADAMHSCVVRLLKTYDENYEAGRGAFTSYAAQAIG